MLVLLNVVVTYMLVSAREGLSPVWNHSCPSSVAGSFFMYVVLNGLSIKTLLNFVVQTVHYQSYPLNV